LRECSRITQGLLYVIHVVEARSLVLPPLGITLHSVFGQSQTFQILTKHIGKTINNYETKYMQYENIFYDNSNDGYFIL
jgi:translation initiation factor RLI1